MSDYESKIQRLIGRWEGKKAEEAEVIEQVREGVVGVDCGWVGGLGLNVDSEADIWPAGAARPAVWLTGA